MFIIDVEVVRNGVFFIRLVQTYVLIGQETEFNAVLKYSTG